MDNNLSDFRDSLDNIDNALIFLLAERFRVTQKVGVYKSEHALPATDEARERSQFERIEKISRERGLNPVFVHGIFRSIIDEVVRNHKALREEAIKK